MFYLLKLNLITLLSQVYCYHFYTEAMRYLHSTYIDNSIVLCRRFSNRWEAN